MTKTKAKKVRAELLTPNTKAMVIPLPLEPSDDVAKFLSRLNWGFSNGERIEDGKKEYARLRDMIIRDGLKAHNARTSTHVGA